MLAKLDISHRPDWSIVPLAIVHFLSNDGKNRERLRLVVFELPRSLFWKWNFLAWMVDQRNPYMALQEGGNRATIFRLDMPEMDVLSLCLWLCQERMLAHGALSISRYLSK